MVISVLRGDKDRKERVRLQVSVNDPLFVRGVESVSDFARNLQRFFDSQRPTGDAIGECGSLDQLHDQRADAVGFLVSVDRCDVGMVQRRQNLRFAAEASQSVRIEGEAAGRILIATSRPSFESCARYTSPIPPNPSRDCTEYEAIRVPTGSGKMLTGQPINLVARLAQRSRWTEWKDGR